MENLTPVAVWFWKKLKDWERNKILKSTPFLLAVQTGIWYFARTTTKKTLKLLVYLLSKGCVTKMGHVLSSLNTRIELDIHAYGNWEGCSDTGNCHVAFISHSLCPWESYLHTHKEVICITSLQYWGHSCSSIISLSYTHPYRGIRS